MSWLIFPKKVQLARLNYAASSAANTYNHTTRERRIVNANDGSPRTNAVVYTNVSVLLAAQIETSKHEEQNNTAHGNVPSSARTVVFNTSDLIDIGLVDATTHRIMLQPNDKLVSVHDYDTEALIELIRDPPGLQVRMAEYIGFGFGDGPANLVRVVFESKAQGAS